MNMIKNLERVKISAEPLATASGLSIGYDGEAIVKDINFTVESAESLAVVGVNGSGKSTLLKTMVGLLPPIMGEMCIAGNVPGNVTRRIAYMSQFHTSEFILPMRAIDVVRMGRYAMHGLLGKMSDEDEEMISQAMKSMRVWNLADKPLQSLSGGQQQRIYISQVLAKHADLLILDEPTAGLDVGAREIYEEAMEVELCRGASVITATHDIQEAMECDQTMLLARKVIAVGKGKDIITAKSLLETFGIVITLNDQNQGITVVEREHKCKLPEKK
jgi:ABC-type Mn2+/Zn2+ transport system ATPase subunit